MFCPTDVWWWRTWKDKILDYEIEISVVSRLSRLCILEKIRFSITRLKYVKLAASVKLNNLEKIRFSITRLKYVGVHIHSWLIDTWKDKILDYEIEILNICCASPILILSWKDKILDYEIEISLQCVGAG